MCHMFLNKYDILLLLLLLLLLLPMDAVLSVLMDQSPGIQSNGKSLYKIMYRQDSVKRLGEEIL